MTHKPGPKPLMGDEPLRTCAIVVTYRPDGGILERLQRISRQVDAVVVVDNTDGGTLAWQKTHALPLTSPFALIENRKNVGLAAALNLGIKHPLALDCQWILTLDQDSECYPDMVRTLLHAATIAPPQAAVIGGNYFDPKSGRHHVRTDRYNSYSVRKTVITSGCLVDAAFAREIGAFREDYFIDQVDHEFCLRARSHGRSIIITTKPVMRHSVGGWDGPRIPLLGWILPAHSALRKYYIARNSIATARTHWRNEPVWCLVRIARLVLGIGSILFFEPDKGNKLKAFAFGIFDAFTGTMGQCRHVL